MSSTALSVNAGAANKQESPALFGWPFAATTTGLYAALLALVTCRHEMWRDELQAWLIARDSATLPALFHNLRYEGHPVLWYLLLFVPAHLSWNPISLQVLNFFISTFNAWLILSFERVPQLVRVALVFGFYAFYLFGVTGRSYMLAFMLLTAATRCLLASQRRTLAAGILLALAINTHIFAVPIAAVLFIGAECVPQFKAWRLGETLPAKREFAGSIAILLVGLVAAYLTVRPPADMRSAYYDHASLSFVPSLVLATHAVWTALLPIPRSYLALGMGAWIDARPEQWNAAHLLSCAVLVLGILALRNRSAQLFFACSALLMLVAIAVTVRSAQPWHYGFVFFAFCLAVLIDAGTGASKPALPHWPTRIQQAALASILLAQLLASIGISALDLRRPYSDAQQASLWLKSHGYDKNPLVIEPDMIGPGIVGYLQKDAAYYPECRCSASFMAWNSKYISGQTVTASDLDTLHAASKLPAVLISNYRLDAAALESLHLQPLHFFDSAPILPSEAMFAYLQTSR